MMKKIYHLSNITVFFGHNPMGPMHKSAHLKRIAVPQARRSSITLAPSSYWPLPVVNARAFTLRKARLPTSHQEAFLAEVELA